MALRNLGKRRRLLLVWSGIALLGSAALGYVVVSSRPNIDPAAPRADGTVDGLTSVLTRSVAPETVRFRFEEIRSQSGIDFQHFPATRRSLLPEDMGSGLAWGDYDNDGDPDLFLVNFSGSVLDTHPAGQTGRSALYRNEGAGRFTDVAASAGVGRASFGLAACWGDYDNDTFLDLYLTNYGPNTLYRNNRDGTFTDITQQAGIGGDQFSAGCSWGDYDNDGQIDLYVSNYVAFAYRPADQTQRTRQYGSETPYTINPSSYPPVSNRLYRNNGDGTFADVAPASGVANPDGRSLGATWFDFDSDGWLDLYVANDVSANGVYRNRGDGLFDDIGASSLAADYRGAMGLAVGDVEHDGDLDLFVTHWIAQENAFFENMSSERMTDDAGLPRLFFMDVAELLGLGQISLKTVGWATGLADFDNDGYLDLWVVNGNTLETSEDHTRLRPQQLHLFRHKPSEGFFEVGRWACPALSEPSVGRGGAHADYDGDGRVDIAVMVHGGQPLLLHNTSITEDHWLTVRLRQRDGNTQALGGRVSLRTGDLVQTAQVGTEGSYLSQAHTDLHFGVGAATRIDELTIRWPDGATETHTDLEPDRVVRFDHTPDYRPLRRPRIRRADPPSVPAPGE